MTWFKRKKDWAAKETLTAADLDSEFDNVAEALNDLFQAGRVNGETLTLKGGEAGPKDIPATGKTLTLSRSSLVIVHLEADIEVAGNPSAKHFAFACLNVDGSDKTPRAEIGAGTSVDIAQASTAASYVLTLAAGSHTLKMRASHQNSEGLLGNKYDAVFWSTCLGYSYLVIPNPEP